MEGLSSEIYADCVMVFYTCDTFRMSFNVKMSEKIHPIDHPWILSSDAFGMKIQDIKVLVLRIFMERMERGCLVQRQIGREADDLYLVSEELRDRDLGQDPAPNLVDLVIEA